MVKVQKVVYGDEWIKVIADNKGYKLVISSGSSQAWFEAASRKDMEEIVTEMKNTLYSIEYELGSYSSVFKDLGEKETKNDGQHEDL